MSDKPKSQNEYLRGRPIEDALMAIAHRDAQCEYQQAEIRKLQAEIERLNGVVYAVAVDAHIAGQQGALISTDFSNAREYASKITTNKG